MAENQQIVDYSRKTWDNLYDYSKPEYDRMARRYRYNFRNLLRLEPTAKILDIGSAGGFFLYYLRSEGFHSARGIDADTKAIEAAKSLNLPVEEADAFEFLAKSPLCFDCITINQVLEHFPRERSLALLRSIYGSLRPGGLIIVSVPNALNPFSGHLMFGDLSHDHLYTPKSLEDSLAVTGFQNISVHPEGPAPYDLLTRLRWGLWKVRELILGVLFAIDIGIGRSNRLQLIFTSSIIAAAHKRPESPFVPE